MGMPVSFAHSQNTSPAFLAPAAGPVPGVPVIPRGALGLYQPLPEHHCPLQGQHLGSPREEREQGRDGAGSRGGAWRRGARVGGGGRLLGQRESRGAAGSRGGPGRAGGRPGGGRGAAGGAAEDGAARGPGRPPLPSPAARLRSAPLPSSPPSAAPLPRAGSGSGGSPSPSHSPRPRPGPARFASARFAAARRLRRARRRRRTMPGPRGLCLLALLLLGSPAAPRPGKRGGAGRSGTAAPGPCASRGLGGHDGVWGGETAGPGGADGARRPHTPPRCTGSPGRAETSGVAGRERPRRDGGGSAPRGGQLPAGLRGCGAAGQRAASCRAVTTAALCCRAVWRRSRVRPEL